MTSHSCEAFMEVLFHLCFLGTMFPTCYGQCIQSLVYCVLLVADVVTVISQLLTSTQHDQIRRHSTFCLLSLVKTRSHDWSAQCSVELREKLGHNMKSLNDPEYEVVTSYLAEILISRALTSCRMNKQLVENCWIY